MRILYLTLCFLLLIQENLKLQVFSSHVLVQGESSEKSALLILLFHVFNPTLVVRIEGRSITVAGVLWREPVLPGGEKHECTIYANGPSS